MDFSHDQEFDARIPKLSFCLRLYSYEIYLWDIDDTNQSVVTKIIEFVFKDEPHVRAFLWTFELCGFEHKDRKSNAFQQNCLLFSFLFQWDLHGWNQIFMSEEAWV